MHGAISNPLSSLQSRAQGALWPSAGAVLLDWSEMTRDTGGASFKRLTQTNWFEPDPTGGAFGEINLATGEERQMTAERWAERILAVGLSEAVPVEVRDLWEVARGVLVYGFFFYPLYTLGDEHYTESPMQPFCIGTASWAGRWSREPVVRPPLHVALTG